MKRSLAHLPREKKDELKAVVEIIRELIDAEFIILFGSYARGDWVEDRYTAEDGITYEYKSDYDLLVVVQDLPKYQYKGYRNRIKYRARKSAGCTTPLSIILHSVEEFKKAVGNGEYFFVDIKKEGIMLYRSGRFRLPVARQLSLKERKNKAQAHFRNWFESAESFFDNFEYKFKKNDYKIAAFELHQAAERFYHTVLLVFTDYKPRTHDLAELGKRVDQLSGGFKGIFPQNTAEEKHLFELLKRAYTEARYNMGYRIARKELEYLAERVTLLRNITEAVCLEKIRGFTVDGGSV
ncbi:MAG: HEPN domain-containing protein [Victivallaceae bacterium]|nr:HEPN domain-containing protein [Victivallaceae bacterium]